ncbi:MAG: hypothetical protein AAGN66_17850 [Acidobacteriota bacterium]
MTLRPEFPIAEAPAVQVALAAEARLRSDPALDPAGTLGTGEPTYLQWLAAYEARDLLERHTDLSAPGLAVILDGYLDQRHGSSGWTEVTTSLEMVLVTHKAEAESTDDWLRVRIACYVQSVLARDFGVLTYGGQPVTKGLLAFQRTPRPTLVGDLLFQPLVAIYKTDQRADTREIL